MEKLKMTPMDWEEGIVAADIAIFAVKGREKLRIYKVTEGLRMRKSRQ